MWFDSWSDLIRIALAGTAGYATLIIVLRISGKRTLSQLNIFDFVVTVALGSILATVLSNTDVSWSEGAAAFALLAVLQFIVAWATSRWPRARGVVTSTPVLLFSDGTVRHQALRRARLTESEVHQVIRESGAGDLADIRSVVLESNGKLSVISASKYGDGSALKDVKN
ncbi:YetF domain-containing protein [Salinibacterium sp. TMP30]|uniref:DUF421 domain-containing protein n=1 Tax=Salinibacterium sp. TMP30 TaxID=3138237 RepID=UPI0031393354